MTTKGVRRDIGETVLYQEAELLYRDLRRPGTGQISDATGVHASPAGNRAVFAGTIVDTLVGTPPSRICEVDLSSGAARVLTFGPNSDRSPRYSPDGRNVAFLSDRRNASDFQLYLLDLTRGAARPAPPVDGWVEYLRWSPNGERILLGVAGHGADVAGVQGAVTSKHTGSRAPTWTPTVESGKEKYRWRRAWVYELRTDRLRQASPEGSNVWEAGWCGNGSLAAIVSPGPGEGLWYSARLHIIDVETCDSREVYVPQGQLGYPAASPSGKRLAVVEAICSDRCMVAGDLQLIEPSSGKAWRVDTRGVDVTHVEWRSDERALLAGHRGFETVVGVYDATHSAFTETWSSQEVSTGGVYITVSGINGTDDCVLIGETFSRAPEIAAIRQGQYQSVRSFELQTLSALKAMDSAEPIRWKASDGLEIQGWLLLPQGRGPHPIVMNVHGGPVWHWRPRWLGRMPLFVLMLLKRGYGIFFPNPRGSSGRGQDFAVKVLGDVGGADAYDCLYGLDHLVERGIADHKRLGVTGVSYGGFMTSWLITQDSRFSAAMPVAPYTNQVTAHLVGNIPHFVAMSLADKYIYPGGKYFDRSPIMHAHRVKTPTLSICGALDRCTPPEEAVQFHNALLENGVESVLITYPEEGHGIQNIPAGLDFAARATEWFQIHMPSQTDCRSQKKIGCTGRQ